MKMSRREVLSGMGCLALGATTNLVGSPAYAQEKKSTTVLPWSYKKLDPDLAAERAYKGYFSKRCMFGAFDAIIGELADKYGEPYASFPSDMMVYGRGGVAGWGSLCGALNGAAAAIQLVSANPEKLISELYSWSEQTALPDVKLNIRATKSDYYPSSSAVQSTVSGSVLCHIIISKWAVASGKGVDTPDKKQRCAQFSAAIAKKAVQLLNDEQDGKLVLMHPLTDETEKCSSCHSGKTSSLKSTQGKMECLACHADHMK